MNAAQSLKMLPTFIKLLQSIISDLLATTNLFERYHFNSKESLMMTPFKYDLWWLYQSDQLLPESFLLIQSSNFIRYLSFHWLAWWKPLPPQSDLCAERQCYRTTDPLMFRRHPINPIRLCIQKISPFLMEAKPNKRNYPSKSNQDILSDISRRRYGLIRNFFHMMSSIVHMIKMWLHISLLSDTLISLKRKDV